MGAKKLWVLMVEDEADIRDMIRFSFEASGLGLLEAETAIQAEKVLGQQAVDLILLDWMLPGMSGIDFVKKIKQNANTKIIPIIMLTAKAEEENKIKGLEIGADDYITKPFSPRELIARIKTVLRRGGLISPEGVIQINELQINVNSQEVKISEQSIELTPNEYRLLHFLVKHKNRIFSRAQLLDQVWGLDCYIDERTVDVQIRRLRNQLKPQGYDKCIKTVRSTGYQFVEPQL